METSAHSRNCSCCNRCIPASSGYREGCSNSHVWQDSLFSMMSFEQRTYARVISPFLGKCTNHVHLSTVQKRIGWKSTLAFLSLIFIGDCFELLTSMVSVGRMHIVWSPLWILGETANLCLTYTFFGYLVKRSRLRERIGYVSAFEKPARQRNTPCARAFDTKCYRKQLVSLQKSVPKVLKSNTAYLG